MPIAPTDLDWEKTFIQGLLPKQRPYAAVCSQTRYRNRRTVIILTLTSNSERLAYRSTILRLKATAGKMTAKVTPYQERVYALLVQIPSGRITSYKSLSDALNSSPRAIGGALRNNPFAPEVPCHRCIASTGFVGGFMGDWNKAPSGINQEKKIELLRGEGVEFDEKGMLLDKGRWWDEFKV
ncbi:hypothetical protein V500_04662 [Pseudogymnoascus sp. VKM F-4518 (FW-2643)]|nr:hypothetical protein V500_04662 [Pseudogymnoascus sp. VKM F-4518 (FW-2643)]KFZ16064.1 hypothetical protein V502_05263 [Pseudogymnoascus sp. VKM F-4520 (FW-2644)]